MDARILELPPGRIRDLALGMERVRASIWHWWLRNWTRETKGVLLGGGVGLAIWWATQDWLTTWQLMGSKVGAWMALIWMLGVRMGALLTETRQDRMESDGWGRVPFDTCINPSLVPRQAEEKRRGP